MNTQKDSDIKATEISRNTDIGLQDSSSDVEITTSLPIAKKTTTTGKRKKEKVFLPDVRAAQLQYYKLQLAASLERNKTKTPDNRKSLRKGIARALTMANNARNNRKNDQQA